MDVMCGTCGFETSARNKDQADKRHQEFDPAHEPHWYKDGDADKPVW